MRAQSASSTDANNPDRHMLGVRCEHCHVGEGNDLSKFDFASDARPAKAVARKMILMLRAINGPLLEGAKTPLTTAAPVK